MQCPKCQFENPEGMKFCVECGKKLEKICLKCGFNNSLSFKFCGECGQKLSVATKPSSKDLSFNQKIEKIQKYLPKGLTEKILSQRDKIEGERKQVTVMFCDMEGFTELSEKLGPEDAYYIMDKVYEILIHNVHDYEGTVNEMTGDGIMALFGAPIALEDAPQRAIRSSLSINKEIAKFNDRLKDDKKSILSVRMRIGIHTGPVVVGALGNNLRVEFKAVGDTVNLASRMEGLAEPGMIYITEDTFKLTEGFFRFESLGKRQVKGKEEPVKIYRVIAPSIRRTRFDVNAERGLTPFVGRDRELEILLDGFERAKEGRGQAFSIVSEAGVGKSRLLYEFRKIVINENVTFLEGKCLSYSRGVAYHLIIDVLKSAFNIREDDRDFEIKGKVKKGLDILEIEEESALPYVLELLSVKESGINQIPMSPEAKKERFIETLKRIVFKDSVIRPLILAFEDLHWIDKSSEDSLKDLFGNISGARVLLIITYRPDFVHLWGGKSYHNQVNLNRLSNRESLAMVNHLLGSEDIDANLEELILEKTEGVPFFIEEFIKSIKDLKIIEKENNKYKLTKDIQELATPSTIQEVIMARIDSLPLGAREVFQIGSVIEREFSYELIKQVMGKSQEELLSELSVLKEAELLYERGIYPEITYIFKHALIQEVAYDSILIRKKKKFHDLIGNSIEKLYKDSIEEHYGVLAEHFIVADDFKKGAEYSMLAAKKAEKAASFAEAVEYAEKRIGCLEKLRQSEDVSKMLIDARTTLGLYMFQRFYFVEAKDAIDPIIELAKKINNKKRLSQIDSIVGAYKCFIEENFSEASKHFQDALKISEETNDTVSSLFSGVWFGWNLFYNCEFEKAIYHAEKALDINTAANSLWGMSTMKAFLSLIYNYKGNVSLGYQISLEAIRIAEKNGDIYSKAGAYTMHGSSRFLMGNFKEAEKYLLIGKELCDRINWFIVSAEAHRFLAKTYFNIGEYQKSKLQFANAAKFLKKNRICPSRINLDKIDLARAKVMNNETFTDLESLYRYVDGNNVKLYEGQMRRSIGEILLNIDDQHISEAEDWINGAIEADSRNGMKWNLARDYALSADLYKRQDDKSKVQKNLSKAIKIFKECGALGWLKNNERDWSQLHNEDSSAY